MKRLLLLACGVTLAFGAPLAAQVTERGTFVIRVGSDSFGTETFATIGDTMRGTVTLRGQPRVDYLAVAPTGGALRTLLITVQPTGGADSVPKRAMVTIRRDTATVESNGSTARRAVATGTVPVFGSSFAMMEELTRRARARGTDIEVPVLVNGATVAVAKVRLIGRDSMEVTLASLSIMVFADADGRILSADVPSQYAHVTRAGDHRVTGGGSAAPDYSVPAGAPYRAIEVRVAGQHGIILTGTLTEPTGAGAPFPAVVTITGSGQEDRDEMIPFAGGIRIYRQVADTLGRRGIAVLRLDDRLIGGSGGPLGTTADYADDIRGGVAFLRSRPEIDGHRIGLIGHSEGGEIAPMVAATDTLISGIVLLAGPGRTGREIELAQNRLAIDAAPGLSAHARDSIMTTVPAALDSLGRTNAWFGFFLNYDPIPTARRVHAPVLILQGTTDQQVSPDQAPILADAFRAGGNRDVTVRTFANINHLFVPDSNGSATNYVRLTDPHVPAAILGTIADWFAARLRASAPVPRPPTP